jgi:endonuclease YncB( thermonuclease family)
MEPKLYAAALLLAVSAPAMGETLVGSAEVIDGDTLTINGTNVRLVGIDAPESQQTCDRAGTPWDCGAEAARQLGTLIAGRQVICEGHGTDGYGRTLATCSAAGLELNRTMVQEGWAVAFRRYSDDYVGDEFRAKSERSGMWDSTFMLPEEWRAAHADIVKPGSVARRTSAARSMSRTPAYSSQSKCMIKGNRNRKGQWIYHLPGMPYYDVTRPEEWFCTETQAQAAGYRRAIVR